MSADTDTKDKQKPATPNLDRMVEVQEQSQAIGEFLEWLQDEESDNGQYLQLLQDRELTEIEIEELLARFFDIDARAVAQERDALLEHIRADAG